MTREHQRSTFGVTRRSALRTVVLASGLAVGGPVIGMAGARRQHGETIVRANPVHTFVSAVGDPDESLDDPEAKPAPKPDSQDRLVERRTGKPVDDGVLPDEVDGTHWLRWGEFSAVQGIGRITCNGDDTDVDLSMTGLVPGALYTLRVVVFKEDGFDFETRDLFPIGGPNSAKAAANLIGAGPLGRQDSSEAAFTPTGSSARVQVTHPSGPLIGAGNVGCLLDEYEVSIAASFHLDGKPGPGFFQWPTGTVVEQIVFTFGQGV